jgi:thiamine transport system substrate-binding protein
MSRLRSRGVAAAAAITAVTVSACSVGGGTGSDQQGDGQKKPVVVATHDSWAMSKSVMRQFTKQTGYPVKIESNGDAGQLTNKLVLTKGSPIADMFYGIDNTFSSRAVSEGITTPFTPSTESASAKQFEPPDAKSAAALTPVDYGDVCVNVDDTWFAKHHLAEPRTLDDLTKPAYRNLFVTPGASTSSTGLAFMLATVAEYGPTGWQGYWKKLMGNGAKITAGWDDAYEVDFTGGGGKNGDRPIVASYDTSPPYTIPKGGTKPTTSALLDTCFRQVEYAGLLKGGSNPAGAKAFISFMQGHAFQAALPENMYVFPVDKSVPLPQEWAKYAATPDHPYNLPPQEIAANRDSWLRAWGDIATG